MRKLLVMIFHGTLALLLLTVGAFAQAPQSQTNEFVIRNTRVFDGSRVIPNGYVWVRNGTIKAVGPHIKIPSGIRVIDGTGKTLLPGLIDAHVHTMGMDKFLQSALALGVICTPITNKIYSTLVQPRPESSSAWPTP